jgi:gluconokinase
MILLLMGVAGSGKTTIGQRVAARMGWEFSDADSFHSEAAIARMGRREPLTDADRAPWLARLRTAIESWLVAHRTVILACSALKADYRRVLYSDDPRVKLVYLKGSFDCLAQRLRDRPNHFMKVELLNSQFAILEEPSPAEALHVDISQDLETIVLQICDYLLKSSIN